MGLQVQRFYHLHNGSAVTTGVETVIVGRVFMEMTIGLSGRASLAVGSGGNRADRNAAYAAGTCVGTNVFNVCIA